MKDTGGFEMSGRRKTDQEAGNRVLETRKRESTAFQATRRSPPGRTRRAEWRESWRDGECQLKAPALDLGDMEP